MDTSKENTDTWSSADQGLPDLAEKETDCPICKGARFVHPLLPDGGPDYSRLVACKCTGHDSARKRMGRLQSISNLGNLTNLTFENLLSQGRSADTVSQKFFTTALEEIKKVCCRPPKDG